MFWDRYLSQGNGPGGFNVKSGFNVKKGIMTTQLFTIAISAFYRGSVEIYSAQAIACNGEKLYYPAESLSVSGALEKLMLEMRLQEKSRALFR